MHHFVLRIQNIAMFLAKPSYKNIHLLRGLPLDVFHVFRLLKAWKISIKTCSASIYNYTNPSSCEGNSNLFKRIVNSATLLRCTSNINVYLVEIQLGEASSMLQSQAQPKWDSGFPHFGVGAGMKGKLAKDWQLQRIPSFITHMCHIIDARKALRVGSYVGEPSRCDNGEPVSGCVSVRP